MPLLHDRAHRHHSVDSRGVPEVSLRGHRYDDSLHITRYEDTIEHSYQHAQDDREQS
jgi:hypothetical protein